MTDQPSQPGQPSNQPPPQEIRQPNVSARVPEAVSKGAFSTGVAVLWGQQEFVIDFLVRMARPYHVAARVVMPPVVMGQFIAALRENMTRYEQSFGPIPKLPVPPNERRPTLQEIYDDLKLNETIASGSYANLVLIGHTPAEFGFDFITSFFPWSSVSCRVFLAAPHIPRMYDAMLNSFEQYQKQVQLQQQAQQPPQPRPPSPPLPGMPGTPGTPGGEPGI